MGRRLFVMGCVGLAAALLLHHSGWSCTSPQFTVAFTKHFLLPILPCEIASSSNNIWAHLGKIAVHSTGRSNNSLDREIFPAWLSDGVSMVTPYIFKADFLDAFALRINTYQRALLRSASKPAMRQVVYIGAGFDTKVLGLVMSSAHHDTMFFDIDLPEVIHSRRCLLDRSLSSAAAKIQMASGNLNLNTVHELLAPTPYIQAQPTVFIEDATFMYIKKPQRDLVVSSLISDSICGSVFHLGLVCRMKTGHCLPSGPSGDETACAVEAASCVLPIPFNGRADFVNAVFRETGVRVQVVDLVNYRSGSRWFKRGSSEQNAIVEDVRIVLNKTNAMTGMVSFEKLCDSK